MEHDTTNDPFARAHELDDFGVLHDGWAGIRPEHHEVEGTRVRVLATGEQTDLPTLVAVHGLGGSATNWLEVARPLAADRRVLALDLPGFGETAPPRPTSSRPAAAARLLATLLRRLDVGPVVLMGNSMGGLVSTLLAADHPELVDRLVLVAPALPQANGMPRISIPALRTFAPFAVPVVGTAVLKRRYARMTPEERYHETIRIATARPHEVPERLVRLGVANVRREAELPWRGRSFGRATAGLLDLLVGGGRDRALRAVDEIVAPTQVLWGDRDQLVHRNVLETLRRRRPDFELVELEGLGHVPMLEAPDTVVHHVRSFLTEADVVPLRG